MKKALIGSVLLIILIGRTNINRNGGIVDENFV